jgi:orotidine-5'-phosphate decarboxylase
MEEGPKVVKEIRKMGVEIFLDLKYHDIPNTVSEAAVRAMRLGVSFFNIHALGGAEMMRRCVEACREVSIIEDIPVPKILGVTILTHLDQGVIESEIGLTGPLEDNAIRLIRLSLDAGLDGVVSSPEEIKGIRKEFGQRPIIITPGVRPSWTSWPAEAGRDDQRRTKTPFEAIRDGADYIVVGRPILRSDDPVMAVQMIINEIEQGIAVRQG